MDTVADKGMDKQTAYHAVKLKLMYSEKPQKPRNVNFEKI